jgi:hypothetical protein
MKKQAAFDFYCQGLVVRHFGYLRAIAGKRKDLRMKHDYFNSVRLITRVERIFEHWRSRAIEREYGRVDLSVRVLQNLLRRCLSSWRTFLDSQKRSRELLSEACVYVNVVKASKILRAWSEHAGYRKQRARAIEFAELHYVKLIFTRW